MFLGVRRPSTSVRPSVRMYLSMNVCMSKLTSLLGAPKVGLRVCKINSFSSPNVALEWVYKFLLLCFNAYKFLPVKNKLQKFKEFTGIDLQ